MSPACRGTLPAAIVVALSALAACAAAPPRADVADAVAGIQPDRLREHVEAFAALGPRPAGDEERSRATLELLRQGLEGLPWVLEEEVFEAETQVSRPILGPPDASGIQPVIGHEFSYPVRTHTNLLAEMRGTRRPDLLFELGAHYDTVAGSPGADDNGSGIAALLEIARVLASQPPACTVRLCFFALEEEGIDGIFPGSGAHVERLDPAERAGLQAAVVVDMVGYVDRTPDSQRFPVRIPLLLDPPRTGVFLLVIGRGGSARHVSDFEDAAERYEPGLEVFSVARLSWLSSDSKRSDHASYWNAGLPALLLTDTAEHRSPHYHTESDLPETLDYGFLTQVTRSLCAWLIESCDDAAR